MKQYRFLGKRGRTTIPLPIREALDLEDHDLLSFSVEGDAVVIRREQVTDACAESEPEDYEELFDSLPIVLQQKIVAALARRLMRNRGGVVYGRR